MQSSDEQKNVIDLAKQGMNIVVKAAAGAGKSTTIFFIARELHTKQLLQITYNSSLRLEVKHKVTELGIDNLTIHTYHSLAVKYYSPNAYTDTELRRIVRNNKQPIIPIDPFDILIIDECQDMTKLYFQFMQKFVTDMQLYAPIPIQLIVLGDERQGLYQFKGSDTRFLSLAPDLWHTFPYLLSPDFYDCQLDMSYRITDQMAMFVNRVLFSVHLQNGFLKNKPIIKACRHGHKVQYIRQQPKSLRIKICDLIMDLLSPNNGKYCEDDIFIIGPSLKTRQMKEMENTLVRRGIPCHVPISDYDKIDERVCKNKIVFSTFHSVKGRQRKIVFLFGFDSSYFEYYARDIQTNVCPNTLYVAATRAIDRLYVIEQDTNRCSPLPFITYTHLEMVRLSCLTFHGTPLGINTFRHKTDLLSAYNIINPSELVKFISEDVLDLLLPMIEDIFQCISNSDDEYMIHIPTLITTINGFYEEVSELNGIVIPIMYSENNLSISNNLDELDFDTLLLKSTYTEPVDVDTDYDTDTDSNELDLDLDSLIEDNSILYNMIDAAFSKDIKNTHSYLRDKYDVYKPNRVTTISDYLFLVNMYYAINEEVYSKISQIGITEYTWLDEETLKSCFIRMEKHIRFHSQKNQPQLEFPLAISLGNNASITDEQQEILNRINTVLYPHFPDGKKFQFSALLDMVCDDIVWELKCVSMLTNEHFLQLVLYAWLWKIIHPTITKEFRLFNIRDGKVFKIRNNATIDDLTPIVVLLLKSKYNKKVLLSDDEFIKDAFAM